MAITTDPPDWVKRLPSWVRPDEVRSLVGQPWIAGFIRETDYSLNRAIERFAESQRILGRDTRSADTSELVTTRRIETISLRYATSGGPGVVRSVSIKNPFDAARVKGIAVPYGERSTPVQIRGIRAYERRTGAGSVSVLYCTTSNGQGIAIALRAE
jgi:hypothetical protein